MKLFLFNMKVFGLLGGIIHLLGITFYFLDGILVTYFCFLLLQIHIFILIVHRDLNEYIQRKMEEEMENDKKLILEKYPVRRLLVKIGQRGAIVDRYSNK